MPANGTNSSEKPGRKTTEFWVVAGFLGVMAAVNGGEIIGLETAESAHAWAGKVGTALAAMWTAGQYVLARTNLKQGPAPDRDEVREALQTTRHALEALASRESAGKTAQ